jgi:hypothetical protein
VLPSLIQSICRDAILRVRRFWSVQDNYPAPLKILLICRDCLLPVRYLNRKEASEIMPAMQNNSFLALFQQIFAAFCVLMTEIWLFLFFQISASKLSQLLIMLNTININLDESFTSRIQTNFDSNVAIRTFDHEPPAPKNKHSQTFIHVLCSSVSLILCVMLLAFPELLHTNRIQRKFLFNNGIQSQKLFSRLSHCPKLSNLFKPFFPLRPLRLRRAVTSRRRYAVKMLLLNC